MNGAKRTEGGGRRPDFASGRVVVAEPQPSPTKKPPLSCERGGLLLG